MSVLAFFLKKKSLDEDSTLVKPQKQVHLFLIPKVELLFVIAACS